PKLYIDSCCFIDAAKTAIKAKLPEGRDRDVLFFKRILESSRAGEIELYTSTLTVVECLHAGGDLSDEVKRVFTSLLCSGQYVRLVTPDLFVAERSRDLRWVHDITVKG